jgi:hypothetical protein
VVVCALLRRQKMKKVRPYAFAAIALALILVGYLLTWTLEIQLNVHSGELRKRHTAFGIRTSITDPLPNALSRAADRDGAGYDWLTVSTRSHNRQPCREDWRSFLSCAAEIIRVASGKEESKEFARAILDDLDESRSLSGSTRHTVRVAKALPTDGTQPNILQLRQATIPESVFATPHPSSK